MLVLFYFDIETLRPSYLASSGPKSMAGAALKSATHSILFLRIRRRIFFPLFLHNPAVFPPGGGAVKRVGQDAAVSATFRLRGALNAEVRPLPMGRNRP